MALLVFPPKGDAQEDMVEASKRASGTRLPASKDDDAPATPSSVNCLMAHLAEHLGHLYASMYAAQEYEDSHPDSAGAAHLVFLVAMRIGGVPERAIAFAESFWPSASCRQ